jgi:hypothetical protein
VAGGDLARRAAPSSKKRSYCSPKEFNEPGTQGSKKPGEGSLVMAAQRAPGISKNFVMRLQETPDCH